MSADSFYDGMAGRDSHHSAYYYHAQSFECWCGFQTSLRKNYEEHMKMHDREEKNK